MCSYLVNFLGSELRDVIPYMPKTKGLVRFLAVLFSENSPFRAAAETLVSMVRLS